MDSVFSSGQALFLRAVRPGDNLESIQQIAPLNEFRDDEHDWLMNDDHSVTVMLADGKAIAVRVKVPCIDSLDQLVQETATWLSVPDDAIWNHAFPDKTAGFWEFDNLLITVNLNEGIATLCRAHQ